MKKYIASLILMLSLMFPSFAAALVPLPVNQGGTGVNTITGILKGNGLSAFTAAAAGDFPTLNQNTTGSAAKLTTARTINGTAFDGTANITIATASVTNAMLANSTISGISLGSSLGALTATDTTLTFSGSYDGSAARTVGLNLAHANTWTGKQTFNTTAPTFGTITGVAAQCLHVDTNGLLSGTGSDCGSGSGSGTVTSVDTTTASNGITATWANTTTAARLTISQASATPNTLVASDTTTPHVDTTAGSTNTGYFLVNGKTSGALKITAADATAQTVTLTTAGQTTGAATLTIPDMAHVNKTIAWLESPVFTTPNIGSATGSISGNAGTATALATGRALWGQTFDGTGAITGSLTSVGNITGGASNMTITAGTGASRTLALQTTTAGSTATTALTLAADQSATFANTVNATTFVGALTGTASGNLVSGGALGTPSSGTLTNVSGLPISGLVASTSTALGVGSIELGHASDTTIARVSSGVISVEGVTVDTISAANTLTNKTLTTPVINGTITGTGQATAATASTITMRDSNANITANNWLGGYTTTVTSSTPITLTVGSTYLQYLTGSTAQTLTLPVVSTLALGTQFVIVNNSSAVTTVKSSGASTVQAMVASSYLVVTSIATTGTDQTVWSVSYSPAATNANTASTLVLRDASGNFSAGTITAALTGNASTSTKTTNIIGGNGTTLLGSLPYQSNTDTTSLLSPNTTTTKKFLTMTGDGTNGVAPGWNTIATGDVPTLNQNTTGTANIAGGTAGAIPYQSSANTTTVLAATATANKILLSGASAAPVWSTPTFPNASATSGKIIKSDGTNWTASTETYAAPGTSGNVLTSDGTNWTSATPAGAGTTSLSNPMPPFNTGITDTTIGTNTVMSVCREYVPVKITATKLSFSVAIKTTTGTFKFAVYSDDGQTLTVPSTSTASVTAAGIVTTTISSTVFNPGYYYFAILPNSTANSNINFYGLPPDSANVLNVVTSAARDYGTVTVTASTIPSTITPTSITDDAANPRCMVVRLDA